ncbi:30S ribosomal protein S13 [Candidatus Woesearchaeota archaeon]|nr:30S ribosomal protein S13 [Candidatus Woesearchaeota archaeon]
MADEKAVEKDFRHLVRIMDTDLDGRKQVISALRQIKGVSHSFANAVCVLSNVGRNAKTGNLSDEEVKRLDSALKGAAKSMPVWMLNRRKDYETGENLHLFSTDYDFAVDSDIRLMKKVRSYRGVRHGMGAPVRGQRTRSNFRRNKGKVMGVVKKKVGGKTG